MLAAVTRSPGQVVVGSIPRPGPPRAGNVIVRPETVGICGSDCHLYSGDVGALSGLAGFYPRIQGHEVSAIVTDPGAGAGASWGAEPGAVAEGDRVAIFPLLPCGSCYPCRNGRANVCTSLRLIGVHEDGGLQQLLEVPAPAAFGVGDLDAERTALVEPASIVMHALARGGLRAGEHVVVFGAGPIGLITVLAAASAAARVFAVDPISARRDLAKRLGAEEVCPTAAAAASAVRDWTDGAGPRLVVETSGDPEVLGRAVEMVAAAGRVVVVGMSSGAAELRPGAFPAKEIDVLGSSCATATDFRAAVRLVRAHRTALFALCTHHFPLARTAEAFEFALRRPPDAIKVLITIGDPD